jgi:phospholipid/cholesterol/gamma-HCH transport system substrate-binding protein
MARTAMGLTTLRRLQGLAFVVVIVMLLGLTVLIYEKKLPWQSSDKVTVLAGRIGNQLIIPADVEYKGVLVGRVSSVESNGSHATLNLQISRSQISNIPENVVARILPKTLFGEKYVDFVPNGFPSTTSMHPGQTIPQDHSVIAVELQTVFQKLIPVLRAVKPADLSVALANTAGALRGRGNELGNNLVLIDRYFRRLNRDLPNIRHDISGLADLASNYADAAPDLLRILHNFSVTASTFTVKRDSYAQFLAGTAGFATTATAVLRKNGPALIKLANTSVGPLNLLSDYSIVLECLPKGLSIFDRERLQHAFQGGELHVELIPVNDRGAYTKADRPTLSQYTNPVLPANCYGLPYGSHKLAPKNTKFPLSPSPNYSKGGLYGQSSSSSKAKATTPQIAGSTAGVGSPAEQGQIGHLLTSIVGSTPSSSGLDDLLLGPLLRGMAVTP